jgi:N-acetylmuramoyl-L-alanine amidase
MLRTGQKSLQVGKLQLQLRRTGYYTGLIDAVFGNATERAVLAFQSAFGLVADGIAGPMTNSVLDTQTKNAWLVLFLHTTASPEDRHFTGDQVKSWHMDGNGWSRPGYSDVIELDGKLSNIWAWGPDPTKIQDWEYTFGVKFNTGFVTCSRDVCYVGGIEGDDWTKPKDTRTDAQKYVMELYVRWCLLRNPNLIVAGHNQVQMKACPSFDVPQWCRSIGIPEYNICNWGRLSVT